MRMYFKFTIEVLSGWSLYFLSCLPCFFLFFLFFSFFILKLLSIAERVESAVQSLREDFAEQQVWVCPLRLLRFILSLLSL